MTRFDDPLHDQRMEERNPSELDLARQYAADTIRLADQSPSKPGPRPTPRPKSPQWGDDLPDPINGPSPTPEERAATEAEHRRRFPW